MGVIPRKTLLVRRYAAGDYNTSGNWVEGTPGDFNILASVQPLRGKEMEMLPEARRESQAYKLYTDTQLLTINTTAKTNSDRVQIEGNWFEVLIAEPWQNTIIDHYKVIVVEL